MPRLPLPLFHLLPEAVTSRLALPPTRICRRSLLILVLVVLFAHSHSHSLCLRSFLPPPALPSPACLLASRASLRTFQSTGFLKDKGIALSSKVIYGPKGLQFIQFLLFFPLLFAFFCMFLSPFAVCCLFQLPLPLLLLLLLALVVLKSLGVGWGLGLGVEQSGVEWSGMSVSGLMLRSSRQKCEYASLVYFCAFRQFSFICQRVSLSLSLSPAFPISRLGWGKKQYVK